MNKRIITRMLGFGLVILWLSGLSFTLAIAANSPKRERAAWGDFVETNFPFFSSVLDARHLGQEWPSNNLTPRGIILNLGHGCWACFDTDLLRVSAIWTGNAVSPV